MLSVDRPRAPASKHSQSADNGTADKSLNPANDYKDERSNPYELPIAPLYYACPQPHNEVYAPNEEQGPVYCKAYDVTWVIEIVGP